MAIYIHMLSYIFNFKNNIEMLDVRDLPTRRHDGILFKDLNPFYPKAKRDPFYRATNAWNLLPVPTRNIVLKEVFKKRLIADIHNPFKTFV